MGKKAASKARVLIVDNESMYMAGLKKTIKKHAKGKADVNTVHVKNAKSEISPGHVPYDAVILSGSFKRRYDSPEVQYVIETVDKHNKNNPDKQVSLYGSCLGHQAIVHYHKGKIVDLGKYQKGDKKIQLKEGGEVKTHKHHRWGVTKAPDLEAIANSKVKNIKGKEVEIIEAVRHATKHYVASQGHAAREGHARDLLYEFMDKVYRRAA